MFLKVTHSLFSVCFSLLFFTFILLFMQTIYVEYLICVKQAVGPGCSVENKQMTSLLLWIYNPEMGKGNKYELKPQLLFGSSPCILQNPWMIDEETGTMNLPDVTQLGSDRARFSNPDSLCLPPN